MQIVQAKTYLTRQGYNRLSDELKQWVTVERPKVVEIVAWAASNGDRSENGDYLYGKRRLREIDRRIGYLTRLLKDASVVDSSTQTQRDVVFFGAKVTYINEVGMKRTVHIVGTEEADPSQERINYHSPLAKALLKKKCGDEISVQTPAGLEIIEILAIQYE